MSEHTAEYIIVPAMTRVLNRVFEQVIPFYFWSTREGSSVATVEGDIRLLAVFPRRPKVIVPRQDSIMVKFNKILFETAQIFNEFGIPTFAGVPLVSSLDQLCLESRCAWFYLQTNSSNINDVNCNLRLDNLEISFAESTDKIEGPLSDEQLIHYVSDNSHTVTWEEAILKIKDMRCHMRYQRGQGFSRFWFLGGCKPYYMALKNKSFTTCRHIGNVIAP